MKNENLAIIGIAGILFVIIFSAVFFSGGKTGALPENLPIRPAAVAGAFYPADKDELGKEIDGFLANAQAKEDEQAGEITSLIVPHAGYQFSGQVAAYGYRQLVGKNFDTVIIIGNSHYEQFDGVSIYPRGYFETPLGKVEIDSDLAQKIMQENQRFFFKESPHVKEHALEVQIPFLQKTLKNFKIVPILFGNVPGNDYQLLAQAIAKNIIGKKVLLIASSDLSHYPSYEDSKAADAKTIGAILTGQTGELEKTIENLKQQNIPNAVTFACAEDAVKTVMLASQELGANKIELLDSANSGDTSENKTQVVGYAAIGFFSEKKENLLDADEQKQLLEIARTSVDNFVKEGTISDLNIPDPGLNENLGAFVTIKEHGQLRGCIGAFTPTDTPLYQTVQKMAIAAAVDDHRFKPITEDELPGLTYEISVLSQMQKIDDWQKIELGKDGVQVRSGSSSGVFLPQVALENNWDLETFLSELCSQKAGLESDCYKKENTELYIFTAQVFD